LVPRLIACANSIWERKSFWPAWERCSCWQFQLRMETNSVITSPSGTMVIKPGFQRITGLAWSGHGKIAKVEISTDGAKSWKEAQLNLPALPKAQSGFQIDWTWDGKPTKIVSRSIDNKGNVQPDRRSFITAIGTNALFHYNAQQTWNVDETGRVHNVLD
jgi:sulfane dehydrogenase subunit SoxC